MKTLCIVVGIGPLSTFYFGEMVVRRQNAPKDQDNVPMVVLNDTTIPDRTEYLLDPENKPSPLPGLLKNIRILNDLKVDYLTLICNTSYAFIDEMEAEAHMEILKLPELAILKLIGDGVKKAGLASTSGTRNSGIYQKYADAHGLELITVSDEIQDELMEIIYGKVKANKPVAHADFEKVAHHLFQRGCEKIILGCTELSVLKNKFKLPETHYIDPLEALADVVIEKCTVAMP
jgi:aspartate racemase